MINYALTPVFIIALAGIFNGSYPALLKRLSFWSDDTKWLFFSIMAFFIMPLIVVSWVCPQWPHLYQQISDTELMTLCIGGLLYGSGMICFTFSLRRIGMGVAFALNISLGTVFGSLLPTLIEHPHLLDSELGRVDIAALALFVLAIILISWATSLRDDHQSKQSNKSHANTLIGILLGALSGLLCSAQGAAYGLSSAAFLKTSVLLHINKFAALSAPWLLIFWTASLIYTGYHYYLLRKKSLKLTSIIQQTPLSHYLFLICMGALYFMPLIMYSDSMSILGNNGHMIGWPLLMSTIILSANSWSIIRKEWQGAQIKEWLLFCGSIVLLLLAVILLAWGSNLSMETHQMVASVHQAHGVHPHQLKA